MKLWIAREKSGSLILWFNKPVKQGDGWYNNDGYFILDSVQFPEVTFENSPMEVKLVIKSQNKVTECYNCHEVIKFAENNVIDGWYVKCPCCGKEISILP